MSVSRTIVVTGGSRGIGAAIAAAFLARGDRVVAAARTADQSLDTANLQNVVCDMTRRAEVQRLFDTVTASGRRLDVVVNNVGLSAWRPLAQIDEPFWDEMLAANLTTVLFSCQAAAPLLSEGGVIINISSLAGKRGSANNAAYCAAKFGVNGLTQALAKELGPRGIRVNAICPVYVRTEGLDEALAEPHSPAGGGDISSYLAEFARSQAALQVLPTDEQVAQACAFLASPAAAAITGQCINVDCGVMPQ